MIRIIWNNMKSAGIIYDYMISNDNSYGIWYGHWAPKPCPPHPHLAAPRKDFDLAVHRHSGWTCPQSPATEQPGGYRTGRCLNGKKYRTQWELTAMIDYRRIFGWIWLENVKHIIQICSLIWGGQKKENMFVAGCSRWCTCTIEYIYIYVYKHSGFHRFYQVVLCCIRILCILVIAAIFTYTSHLSRS